MKTLAGANPDAKPDYRTQAFNEIHKLEGQIILLVEMLENSVPGERSAQGDAYDVSKCYVEVVKAVTQSCF